MTVQIIISKDIDLSDEDLAIYLNNGILDYVTSDNWIIDNISTIK
jgi:hypothetical protein